VCKAVVVVATVEGYGSRKESRFLVGPNLLIMYIYIYIYVFVLVNVMLKIGYNYNRILKGENISFESFNSQFFL